MRHIRSLVLVGLIVATVGSLAVTISYAWYLRSERYRQYCATYLSESLALPSDIGRVVPRSWSSREFDDVAVWLPGRRDQALFCEQAVLVYTPEPNDPEAYEIELYGGTCEISTRTWLREDYRRVIESGLRPGFDPEGPRRVRFSGMNLHFKRDRFRVLLENATGVVEFATHESGWIAVHCNALNRYVAPQPVVLTAQFSPYNSGVRVDELVLRIPDLPVSVLGLRDLVGFELHSGTFSGQLLYRESGDGRSATLSGKCHELSLEECTAGLTPYPWHGTGAEIELKELTLKNGRFQRLRFGGILTEVVLGDVLSLWGLEEIGGELVLRVREADLSHNGIERLIASGQCESVSLEALSKQFGLGGMSGTARLVIDDLTVEQNRLSSLNAELVVEQRAEPNWIEGRLLEELVQRILHVNLPPLLPERIEYTHLGFRLDVRDEVLYVFGTHGPREKTILTVRLLDQEIPLLTEPEQPFELSSWFDQLRARAAAHVQAQADRFTAQRAWEALLTLPFPWRLPNTQPTPYDADIQSSNGGNP